MIYFDSDMSRSTNTVVYFDWKMVIYIYACRKCRTQFMLEKSVTVTGANANEIIPSITRSFFYKVKEGCHVRMGSLTCKILYI
jgi:predicted nucleic-acid-binding Zn-ribbon protein